jgi:hypothetical protein
MSTFDPFSRHRGTVETTAVVDSKPVEPNGLTASPFSHHEAKPKDQPKPERSARELLVWIQQYWNKPIISLRDIQVYGPYTIRERQTAINQAETLERNGWLIPLRAHRRDRRVWKPFSTWNDRL